MAMSAMNRRPASAVQLERVVRPFYKATPQPGRSKIEVEDETTEEAVIEWEAASTATVTTLASQGVSLSVGGGSGLGNQQEISRSVRVTRVYNPSDPSQYVDVESPYLVNFRDASGKKSSFRFNS